MQKDVTGGSLSYMKPSNHIYILFGIVLHRVRSLENIIPLPSQPSLTIEAWAHGSFHFPHAIHYITHLLL